MRQQRLSQDKLIKLIKEQIDSINVSEAVDMAQVTDDGRTRKEPKPPAEKKASGPTKDVEEKAKKQAEKIVTGKQFVLLLI